MRSLVFFSALFYVTWAASPAPQGKPQAVDTKHQHSKWDYASKEYGVHMWKKGFPTCGLYRQSPIDLTPATATIHANMDEIVFHGYDIRLSDLNLTNNGHTAVVAMGHKDGSKHARPSITKGGLNVEGYRLVQFHFHWSDKDSKGSEHTLHGLSYPLELHLVHMREDLDSIGDALGYGDGLAVVGVFFHLEDEDNHSSSHAGGALQDFVDTAMKAKKPKTVVKTGTMQLQDLLPKDRSHFYRYEGSLTTPPCSEAVIWTVFTDSLPVTQAQLDVFRSMELTTYSPEPAPWNYRPTMPLGDRRLFLRRPHANVYPASGVSPLAASLSLPLLALAIAAALLY